MTTGDNGSSRAPSETHAAAAAVTVRLYRAPGGRTVEGLPVMEASIEVDHGIDPAVLVALLRVLAHQIERGRNTVVVP